MTSLAQQPLHKLIPNGKFPICDQIHIADEYTTTNTTACVKLKTSDKGMGAEHPLSIQTFIQVNKESHPIPGSKGNLSIIATS